MDSGTALPSCWRARTCARDFDGRGRRIVGAGKTCSRGKTAIGINDGQRRATADRCLGLLGVVRAGLARIALACIALGVLSCRSDSPAAFLPRPIEAQRHLRLGETRLQIAWQSTLSFSVDLKSNATLTSATITPLVPMTSRNLRPLRSTSTCRSWSPEIDHGEDYIAPVRSQIAQSALQQNSVL